MTALPKVIEYAGRAYGRLHVVLESLNRMLRVQPLAGGQSFWVHILDTEAA
jgi:hypothetical protein